MTPYIFLVIAWTLLALVSENVEIHQAYVAMFGGWIGAIFSKLLGQER